MEKKLNHEIQYENILKQINEDFEAGNITAERKEALISMAIVEESAIRKKEVDDRTKMFNNYNSKVKDNDYYLQCIFQFVDDLYIKCLCSFNDSMIADDKVGFLAMEWKGKGDTKINEAYKKIYDDLKNGIFNILNITKEEIYNNYYRLVDEL